MKAFEFFRYHSVAPYTSPNINAIFYGTSGDLIDEKSYSFRTFKENGYIIGSFADE